MIKKGYQWFKDYHEKIPGSLLPLLCPMNFIKTQNTAFVNWEFRIVVWPILPMLRPIVDGVSLHGAASIFNLFTNKNGEDYLH